MDWSSLVLYKIKSPFVDWSTCICMVVFLKSAPSNCKVVLATSRRSWLHQVKSHNPNTTSQIVFICENGVSLNTFITLAQQCASLEGVVVATRDDVKEGSWSMSWYF